MLLIGMFFREIFISGKSVVNNFIISGKGDTVTIKKRNPHDEIIQQIKSKYSGKTSSRHNITWTEKDLKECTPNYEKINMVWWRNIVGTRRRQQQEQQNLKQGTLAKNNTEQQLPPVPRPLWLPGFPGSGNEMVGRLVQALTGGLGGEGITIERPRCPPSIAATCKTHWPALNPNYADPLLYPTSHGKNKGNAAHGQSRTEFYPFYIVLLRNPMNSIPSYANQRFEVINHLPGHSRQAPEQFWRKHRDSNFEKYSKKWVNLIELWETYAEQPVHLKRGMFLQYEKLTNIEYGLMLTMELAHFLRQAGYEEIVAKDEDIPCLWYHVVVSLSLSSQLDANFKKKKSNNIRRKEAENATTLRGPHKYKPGYTMGQKQELIELLSNLKHRYGDHVKIEARKIDKNEDDNDNRYDDNDYESIEQNSRTKLRQGLEFIDILDGYIDVIDTTMRIDEGRRVV